MAQLSNVGALALRRWRERLKTFYGAATDMSFAVYVFIG